MASASWGVAARARIPANQLFGAHCQYYLLRMGPHPHALSLGDSLRSRLARAAGAANTTPGLNHRFPARPLGLHFLLRVGPHPQALRLDSLRSLAAAAGAADTRSGLNHHHPARPI